MQDVIEFKITYNFINTAISIIALIYADLKVFKNERKKYIIILFTKSKKTCLEKLTKNVIA